MNMHSLDVTRHCYMSSIAGKVSSDLFIIIPITNIYSSTCFIDDSYLFPLFIGSLMQVVLNNRGK